MGELDYVECMVKRKPQTALVMMKFACGFLCVLAAVFFFLIAPACGTVATFGSLIIALLAGFGCYYAMLNANIEYEYQYCEKEITVDKILNKSRRKRIAKYETERMEAFGPISSYHLEDYKNKNYQVRDYSNGVIDKPDTRYVMYYDGREKIIMNPNEKLVAAVWNVAPRKTFKD
ncbi:DUF6106 family protein [Butyrivibrio sp. NC3005]|uniref:DUF6106 family protein n=1 Tax=Butyrivibrio sp. NC3005 TaxID=1280685 RepID=UPI00040900FB|nr:DUF6106 family protein [Butyrivibrio sp. NC3005]